LVPTPYPATPLLPVFISATSVQELPLQDSVFPVLGLPVPSPPNANAAVLLSPAPPKAPLTEVKSPTSVHEVPFQDSVKPFVPLGGSGKRVPPNANADVEVPAPAKVALISVKSLT